MSVVLDTTKVQIFKQITTSKSVELLICWLFQIPQRYRFSSKSQRNADNSIMRNGCFRYHKGTDFQANHNGGMLGISSNLVVLDTTKVQIFKQITTGVSKPGSYSPLFQIPQRYRFSSKSQPMFLNIIKNFGCFRYHKGTDFQANHNTKRAKGSQMCVVLDTTKVQIFKQITTQA